uniref:Cryptochrome circadian regulator 4 n=1 Tax=Astyanax mexicanus TaxID=7994 RepID=A0A8B9H5W9_ASTMX
MPHRTLHLFRKGLRLHDNPTLLGALESSAVVYPVYVLDRAFEEGGMRVGVLRWRFLLQSLQDLHARLRAVGSRLFVVRGSHRAVLGELVGRWGITQISFDSEMEPHHTALQRELGEMAEELGLSVYTRLSHTLYDLSRQFSTLLYSICVTEEDKILLWPIPISLFFLLLSVSVSLSFGTKSRILFRLHKHPLDWGWLENTKTQTVMNSLWPNTTGLSPYLSLGCLSVRTAFFHQYNRIFCPVRFGRRADPEGHYIRKYLPVLRSFPSRYIYEPWTAPEEVQLQAGCIIGKDYPLPMVCHAEVSERNLALMKEVRSSQENTTKLTRGQRFTILSLIKHQSSASKRFSSEPQARPCSWGPEAPRLPEITGQAV